MVAFASPVRVMATAMLFGFCSLTQGASGKSPSKVGKKSHHFNKNMGNIGSGSQKRRNAPAEEVEKDRFDPEKGSKDRYFSFNKTKL